MTNHPPSNATNATPEAAAPAEVAAEALAHVPAPEAPPPATVLARMAGLKLPVPKVIVEEKLVAELNAAAAAGITVFSDKPLYGNRVAVDLGEVSLVAPAYDDGAVQLAFVSEQGVRVLSFLTHQIKGIFALRHSFPAQEPLTPLPPGVEPVWAVKPTTEAHMIFAEFTDESKKALRLEFRCDDYPAEDDHPGWVVRAVVRASQVGTWAYAAADLYHHLSVDQREARLIKYQNVGTALQIPIERQADDDNG